MEVARLLLEHDADPSARDPNEMTAADRAERNAPYTVGGDADARERPVV
jgi:hypothetical protein